MSSLLAVLLVGTSSLGSQLIYSFPPSPVAVPRTSKPIYSTRATHRNSNSTAPGPALDSDTVSSSSSGDSDDDSEFDYLVEDECRPRKDDSNGAKFLGFERLTLASVLSPNRELCDQPFELVIDHLAFVGHPVWLGTDETRPPAPDDDPHRGRPAQPIHRRQSSAGLQASFEQFQISRDPSPATPVVSPSDSAPPSPTQRAMPSPSSLSTNPIDFTPSSHQSHGSASVQDGSGRMSSFNFVCVIDTPPDGHLSSHLERYYNDVVIPLTANIKALERRDKWLGRQAGKIRRSKENFAEKGLSFNDHLAALPSLSTLAAALSQLYTSLKSNSTATINLESLPVQIRLREEVALELNSSFLDRGHARATFRDQVSRSPSPARIAQKPAPLFSRARRRQKVVVKPWQTLLPLEDTEEMKAHVEEGTLLWRFLDICSPTLSFAEYETLLDIESEDSPLEDIIEHLVHWGKAKTLDVVSLKSSYVPSANLDPTTLPMLNRQFQSAFPSLGPLPTVLSRLRAGDPFSTLCSVAALRSTYFAALVWLLQRDVVEKLRTFLRIVASEEVKSEAQMHWGRRDREDSVGSLSGHSDRSASTRSAFSQRADFDDTKNMAIVGLSASPSTRKRTSNLGAKHKALSIATTSSHSAAPDLPTKGPSLIVEPGRPQEVESRWLFELVREKEKRVAERFERMKSLCNGRHDLDEVRWRAGLSRKELRLVLAAFDEAIIQFSHP